MPYTVSILSSMTKVRRDMPGPSGPGSDMHLYAARGEAESAQVLIYARTNLGNVAVSAAPLAGPGGASLSLEIFRVGYVTVTNPTPVGFGAPGPYPDPLLPLAPFDVPAGESRSLWVTAWVPRDAVPGEYTGRIVLAPGQAEAADIAIRVHVFTATLPVLSALRTDFGFWGFSGNPEWYGKEAWERQKPRFMDALLRYRLSFAAPLPWSTVFRKGDDGAWSAQWDAFDREVETWMAKGNNFFVIRRQIIPWFGPAMPPEIPDRDNAAAQLRLLGAHLKQKGWSDRFAFYLVDEPIISDDVPQPGDRKGSENIRNIKAAAQFIHENAPDLRMMMVTCDPAYEAVAMDFPAYVWCPHINHFHADFQRRRQKLGEPSWMYVCMTTWVQHYPDIWKLDRDGVSHRAVGSWLWRYECDGFLYWIVDYWKKDPYTVPDIFRPSVNGDGVLFYPDPEKKQDPFPSIRLALTRDAIEDYDLYALLHQRVTALRSGSRDGDGLAPWLAKADSLLDLSGVIPDQKSFAEDPAVYETRHREILDLLEQLDKAPR